MTTRCIFYAAVIPVFFFAASGLGATDQDHPTEELSATDLLVRTLLEFDRDIKPPVLDGFDRLDGHAELLKKPGGFHFSISGNHFEQLRSLLERMYGPPREERKHEDGTRDASFRRNVLAYLPGKNATVVWSIGRSPVDSTNLATSDRSPKLLFRIPPTYPPKLRRRGIEGRVDVSFWIEPSGTVSDARIIAASHPEFGTAALEAMAKWRFSPARRKGQPTRARMIQPFAFKLSQERTQVERISFRQRKFF